MVQAKRRQCEVDASKIAIAKTTSTFCTMRRAGSLKYCLPVPLHAHDRNAVLGRLVECLRERAQLEFAVVSKLALGVVMVKQEGEARAGASLRVAHHREVTVRIAEREKRTPADVQANVGRLRLAVVEAAELADFHEVRSSLLDLEAQL